MGKTILILILGTLLLVLVGCSSKANNFELPSFSENDRELYLVSYNGRYGYSDDNGKIVIEAKFEEAQEFEKHFALSNYRGKEYVVNKNGEMTLVNGGFQELEFGYIIKEYTRDFEIHYVYNLLGDLLEEFSFGRMDIMIHNDQYLIYSLFNDEMQRFESFVVGSEGVVYRDGVLINSFVTESGSFWKNSNVSNDKWFIGDMHGNDVSSVGYDEFYLNHHPRFSAARRGEYIYGIDMDSGEEIFVVQGDYYGVYWLNDRYVRLRREDEYFWYDVIEKDFVESIHGMEIVFRSYDNNELQQVKLVNGKWIYTNDALEQVIANEFSSVSQFDSTLTLVSIDGMLYYINDLGEIVFDYYR